ncbi:MAG: alpha/beta hydrolase [Pseudomonadota bacterium]
MAESTQFLDGPHGRLAYAHCAGVSPGLVWLGGFRSDMRGSKAEFMEDWARKNGRASLRFDYSGHGESDGDFADGTIGQWASDAAHILTTLTDGPQILIGSSMGGWIAMLLAQRHPDRVAGMVLIAPAPDFTEALMWPGMDEATRQTLLTDGRIETPSAYSNEPEVITRALIEDGRKHLVLDGTIPVSGPVRILQGMRDEDVPWAHALRVVDCLDSDDIDCTLVKDGDHRLSSGRDLDRLGRTLTEITGL